MTTIKEVSVDQKTYSNTGNTAILSRVPENSLNILDLGCGAGDNARILQATGRKVVGVTFSNNEAMIAGPFCEDVIVGNLEHGIPKVDGLFDAVICSHVLEHICYPSALLKDAHSLLRPDGCLLVALPNLMNYRYRLRLLMGRFEYESSGTMDYTHFRWYTFASGRKLLEDHGFEVVEAVANGSFPLWPLRRVMPNFITTSIDGLASRWFPGLFGGQLIYVARPAAAGNFAVSGK